MANVYTESVVTLNASQAESTLNALKSSADELRKKMIEATKLGNTEDAARYKKELDSVNKAMQGIKKETKDYSELMKNLNGASLNQLAKAYSGLNKQIKNLVPGTKEFIEKSKQLQQVKQRMDAINGSVKGTNKTLDALKGMVPKLGLASVFAAAGAAVVKFAKDAVSQTQLIGDKWAHFTYSAQSAYNSFVADLSSGKGWKEMIENMTEAYRVGDQVMTMLDELFELQNSLTLKESEYNIEIEKNKQLMRDTTKSDEERMAAAQEVLRLERELADEKKMIAAQEAEARKMELQQRTKLTDAELEEYVTNYNANREKILAAQEYSAQIKEEEAAIKNLQRVYSMNPQAAGVWDMIEQHKQNLATLRAQETQALAEWQAIDAKYQQSNDELVQNYVQAVAKMNQADAEYYSSTTRSATMLASLKKEMSTEHQTAAENAFKEEIAGVDRHQKEMELKAKEAYATGEINEQQYQSRLISIKETALKSKMAIAERYKKETIEYQSQLLDLTIKQQEEFKKILQESEADAVKVLEDLFAESEAEIEAGMGELDKEIEEQIYHFLDLVEQADMVKAALDPSTALGQQLEAELATLQEMYDKKLLTEEEFQSAKKDIISRFMKENLQLELESWQQGMEKAMTFINAASNMVTALQDAEMASLDAKMAKEIKAAGDNAEKKEQIEAEYEKKKLDTQKKYAVADMVINIAKTIAAGALAVMQAFAQLGPIAGGVFAGILAVTTAAEIATIVAQKNAIMNASPSSSGSSGGASVGSRVPTGYSSGGFTTPAGNDYTEVGVVHANEWVAPASMVRANPIVFRRLEQARKRGTSISGIGGFADGGMTSPSASLSGSGMSSIDPVILQQLTAVLQYIIDNGIPAYVLLSELNSKQELQSSIKNIVSKK